MSLPTLPQHLGPAMTVVRTQLDAEQLAHLAIKVRKSRLRPRQHTDLHVTQTREPLGEHPQSGRFSYTWGAGDIESF